MDSEDSKKLSNTLILILNASSSLLVLGSLFLVQIFSVLYGVSNGIVLQSGYSNSSVSRVLQSIVSQNNYLHDGILEAYVLTVIALMLLETSFMLFLRRTERTTSGASKYVAMHTGFAVIYALVFAIIFIDSGSYLNEPYLWAIYIGLAVSVVVGIYLNYVMRMPTEHQTTMKRSIKVDPSTPFSNMIELQDKIFVKMHGHLRVVDKHFNSAALANFHRLVTENVRQFSKISIVTSTEMMDTGFGKNMSDFKKELENSHVGFEVRFMDDTDKVDQHERIMLDDTVAYKIPPFNIINKRSEHIMLIGHGEAEKRYNYLYSRAISYENYSVKQARGNNEQKPQEQ